MQKWNIGTSGPIHCVWVLLLDAEVEHWYVRSHPLWFINTGTCLQCSPSTGCRWYQVRSSSCCCWLPREGADSSTLFLSFWINTAKTVACHTGQPPLRSRCIPWTGIQAACSEKPMATTECAQVCSDSRWEGGEHTPPCPLQTTESTGNLNLDEMSRKQATC